MIFNGQNEYFSKQGKIISPLRHKTALDVLKNITRQKQSLINYQDYDDQPLFQQLERRNNVFKVSMNPLVADRGNERAPFNIVRDSAGDVYIQQKRTQRNKSVADSYNVGYDNIETSILNRRNQSVNHNHQQSQNGSISLVLKNGSISHDNALSKYVKTEKTEVESPTYSDNRRLEQYDDILDRITVNGSIQNAESTTNRKGLNQTVPLHNIIDHSVNSVNKKEFETMLNGNQLNRNSFDESIKGLYQTNSIMVSDVSSQSEPINLMNYDLASGSKISTNQHNKNLSNTLGLVSSNQEESHLPSPRKQQQRNQESQLQLQQSTLETNPYLTSLHTYQQSYLKPKEQLPNINNIQPSNINIQQTNKFNDKETQNKPTHDTINYASPVKKSIQHKRQMINQDKEELAKLYDQYLTNAKTYEELAEANKKNKNGNYFVTSLKGKSFNINIVSQIPQNVNCPTVESELKTKVYLQNREYKSISPERQNNIHTDRWK